MAGGTSVKGYDPIFKKALDTIHISIFVCVEAQEKVWRETHTLIVVEERRIRRKIFLYIFELFEQALLL